MDVTNIWPASLNPWEVVWVLCVLNSMPEPCVAACTIFDLYAPIPRLNFTGFRTAQPIGDSFYTRCIPSEEHMYITSKGYAFKVTSVYFGSRSNRVVSFLRAPVDSTNLAFNDLIRTLLIFAYRAPRTVC